MKHTQREKQQAKKTLHHQLQMSQVRRGDQPRYPHLLWPLRWTIAHSKRMVPLLTKKRLVTGHSVTPHTHTHTHTHTHLSREASLAEMKNAVSKNARMQMQINRSQHRRRTRSNSDKQKPQKGSGKRGQKGIHKHHNCTCRYVQLIRLDITS